MSDNIIPVPVVAKVSCAAYRERIRALEDERGRLREALEKIASMPLSTSWQQHFFDATEIARAALQGGER